MKMKTRQKQALDEDEYRKEMGRKSVSGRNSIIITQFLGAAEEKWKVANKTASRETHKMHVSLKC
jgi:hypothetical protein